MPDVTVVESYVNPDYFEGKNTPVYAYSGVSGGGITSRMNWSGLGTGRVGTYVDGNTIQAEDSLVFDGSYLDIITRYAMLGSNVDADGVRTDNYLKTGALVSPHYDNEEEPISVVDAIIDLSYNYVRVGGGSSSYNAATDIQFYAAGNTTTTTGTKIASIQSDGLHVDNLNELTGGVGVTIEQVEFKDGVITLGEDSVPAQMYVDSAGALVFIDSIGGPYELSELAQDTTANETITLSGDVTGSGTTGITTTIANDAVESGMLNDNIISGQTALTSGLAGTDELLISDAGTIKRMDVSVMNAYFNANLSFITGNETITLSGDVSGSGTTSIAVTIAASAVEASMINNNAISGKTALTSGLASTDELWISDAGTIKRMDVSVIESYMQSNLSFLTGNESITLSGDVSGSGTTAITVTIANAAVEHAMLNNNAITGASAATTLQSADTFLIYDNSATDLREATITQLQTYMQNNLSFGAGLWDEDSTGILTPATPGYHVRLNTTEELQFNHEDTYIKGPDGGTGSILMYAAGSAVLSLSSSLIHAYQNVQPNNNENLGGSGGAGQWWGGVYAQRYYVDATGYYIDTASSEMTFTDPTSGTVALSALLSGGVDMTNGSNNRITTAVDADTINAEANLTFDGTTLTVAGIIKSTGGNPVFYSTGEADTRLTLNVSSGSQAQMYYWDEGDSLFQDIKIGTNTSNIGIFWDNDATSVGINTDVPAATLDVNGDVLGDNLVNAQYGAFASIDSAAQWYTVAETNGGDHAMAIITVMGYDSGDHAAAKFIVSFHHGQGQITQVAGESYSGYEFSEVALYYNTADRTYGGARFAVLLEPGAQVRVMVEDWNYSGTYNEWIIYEPDSSGDWGDQTGWTQFQVLTNVHSTPLATTGITRLESDVYVGGLAYISGNTFIGDDTTTRKSGYNNTLNIASTGSSEISTLELVGNQTSNSPVGSITFHNTQAGTTYDIIGYMTVERYQDNDAGRMYIGLSDSSANLRVMKEMMADHHYWYINGTSEMILDSNYLYPTTTLGLGLGDATHVFSTSYINRIYLPGTSNTNRVETLQFNTSGGEVTYYDDTSDIRLKQDTKYIENASEKIKNWECFTFRFNDLANKVMGHDTETVRLGISAQSVQSNVPEAVTVKDNGYLKLWYTDLIPVLAAGHNEHTDEIDKLKGRIEQLEKQVQALLN